MLLLLFCCFPSEVQEKNKKEWVDGIEEKKNPNPQNWVKTKCRTKPEQTVTGQKLLWRNIHTTADRAVLKAILYLLISESSESFFLSI